MKKVNNHSAFIDFDGKIKLNDARIKALKNSDKALREKIRKYMKDEKGKEIQPKFERQGGLEMGTGVNPIPTQDAQGNQQLAYDLDDGVYFISDTIEDRKTCATYHSWIQNAVDGHTGIPPVNKSTCIRVIFADGHHIDLPIYFLVKGGIPQLADSAKDFIDSDPRAFAKWFNDLAALNEQLRRIVRYLKAWKNYRETNNTNLSFPSGFALTILAANNFKPNERDDVAFRDTVKAILDTLKVNFSCWRPTVPVQDVFADYAKTRKDDFISALERLVSNCDKAADETNYRTSSEHLRKEFGDRFLLGKDEEVEDKQKRLTTGIGSTIATRPYGDSHE